ncbi:hypothetical protein [Sphingobacterium paucimobilis]|uniref:Uncharacterized protein n=1 Tax=Sphingobacterium paucimobilis HER1398 TaxID=1346330 RepID=U2HB41_9SPHI|nr:hypothetical protein [Sphingobacterium paucimobilis]ERJ58961.1 hypothetical protein M472_09270 [Sphingobacterium paucimobilis HER1398]
MVSVCVNAEEVELLLGFLRFERFLPARGTPSFLELKSLLATYLADLARHNRRTLFSLLKNMGIPSYEVRALLSRRADDAYVGHIIADRILEKQQQRMLG